MLGGKRVLVVVPARGGSKGIPLKNLAKVCGETLIAHVGQFVRRLRFVDEAIVSTDHPEIAAEAVKHGLSVPFIRPRNLSGDLIGDFDVLYHALTEMERLNDREYHVILMLQPTCPMRTVLDVTQTVKKLNEGFDSVWTVTKLDKRYHAHKQLLITVDGVLGFSSNSGRSIIARQQLSDRYIRNGACYAFTRECLLVQQTIMGKRSGAVLIDEPLVNIDTPEDLAEAERRMQSPQQPGRMQSPQQPASGSWGLGS